MISWSFSIQTRSYWGFQHLTDRCVAVNLGAVNDSQGKAIKQKIVSFYRHVCFPILDVELNVLNNWEHPNEDPDNRQELPELNHENEGFIRSQAELTRHQVDVLLSLIDPSRVNLQLGRTFKQWKLSTISRVNFQAVQPSKKTIPDAALDDISNKKKAIFLLEFDHHKPEDRQRVI